MCSYPGSEEAGDSPRRGAVNRPSSRWRVRPPYEHRQARNERPRSIMVFSSLSPRFVLTRGGSFGFSIVSLAPSGPLTKSTERPSARCALDGSSRMVIPPQSTWRLPSTRDAKNEIVLEAITDLNPQGDLHPRPRRLPAGLASPSHSAGSGQVDGTWRCIQDYYAVGWKPETAWNSTWTSELPMAD